MNWASLDEHELGYKLIGIFIFNFVMCSHHTGDHPQEELAQI